MHLFNRLHIIALFTTLCLLAPTTHAQTLDKNVESFISILFNEHENLTGVRDEISDNWHPGFIPMALEIWSLSRSRQTVEELIILMQRHTDANLETDLNAWFQWLWTHPEQQYEHYNQFKSRLYALIDKRFEQYFIDTDDARIRLDEIRWGGVKQDGIPPLRQPDMINAEDAEYLDDDNVVFGIEINGDARAYPKRILAWHEMFVDDIGGIPFAGVYCTLCGAVILYETTHNGVQHEMGTSGFLYRSNKLMYDKATQSLWNTTWGEPVVGPLVGKDIRLKRSYLVTTTWGEWKRRHPDTTVLSLNTGHRRDYGEGVAYQQYFGTDELMFTVPKIDTRLKNKDEVVALVFPDSGNDTLAISADYLNEHNVYADTLSDVPFVILTDSSGANRVYERGTSSFTSYDGDSTATDSDGTQWTLSEDKLTASNNQVLQRLPSHRAFWFGWVAANPETRLVK